MKSYKWLNSSVLLIALLLSNRMWSTEQNIDFAYHEQSELSFLKSRIISMVVDKQTIGSVKYIIIPLIRLCIIYDFFITELQRSKGYGRILGRHVLKRIITQETPSQIVIQPGPFELLSDESISQSLSAQDKQEHLAWLIKAYESENFEITKNRWLVYAAKILYRLLHINEDPRFLMIYNPKKLTVKK